MTFGEQVVDFYRNLDFTGSLPKGIAIMNPLKNNLKVDTIIEAFYTRFFADNRQRFIMLGINPGRLGAGATGIPFTDTIRLNEKCNIQFDEFHTYEPSSAFMYEMIDACGGVTDFYSRFFVSAICPLGFTIINSKGTSVNYNYYDSKELTQKVYGFILQNLKKQLDFGIDTSVCFCLGTGKNEFFLRKLNEEYNLFKKIIALEHPRYIMQYKAKSKHVFIMKYLTSLKKVTL